MQVQVEDVGPCKKLLKIEIPAEKVTEELDKTYKQLNENVSVPGFRRGHVPRWLMESKFGKQVSDDAKEALLTESFDEAVKEKDLRPIGQPKFDEEIEFTTGKALSFGVTIEVHPEFEIEGYKELAVEKPSAEPSDEEVSQRIELIRRRYAKLDEVKDGSPKGEDVVMAQVALKEGDAVYRDIPNHQFIAGDHVLVGMTQEETTKFVTGAEIGKAVEREVTLPDTYGDEAKRGAKMTLSLTVSGIRRPILPEVNEEWAKQIGFDSLDELKDEVKTSLRREKEQARESKMGEQVDEQLLTKVDFELPQDIVESMASRALIRRSLTLRQQGAPKEEIEKNLDTLKEESRKSVERDAKLYFILEKIADKERIFVTEDEVNARIEAIAANYNRSPEQILREFEQGDRMTELRSTMREEKVRSFLLEKATVTEQKAEAAAEKPEKKEKTDKAEKTEKAPKAKKTTKKPAADKE